MSKTNLTTSDLAADSPLSYEQLAELNRGRELAARLVAMSPRERVGAAALLAERTGRELSAVLALFARLVEGAPVPPPAAPAAPVAPRGAQLVPSESRPGLFFIVRNFGESCSCESWRYRRDCKHARRAREERRAQLRALISRATAAVNSRPLAA